MGKAKKAVKKVEKEMMNGVDTATLGWQMFWDVTVGSKGGDRDELLTALENAGIDVTGLVPIEMADERRLRWAMNIVQREHNGTVTFKRAGKTKDHVTYRPIYSEQADDAKAKKEEHVPTIDARTGYGIALDKEGRLILQDKRSKVAKEIEFLYAELENRYNATDVRELLKRAVFRHNGIPLRERGGVYFVPFNKDSETELNAIISVLETLTETSVYMPALPTNDQWKKAASSGAKKTLETEYKSLLSDLEGFANRVQGGDLVQTRALNAKVKQAKELREKAEMFKDILSLRVEDLQTASDCVLNAAKEMLDNASEIRELKKAKGSDNAKDLAESLAKTMAENANKFLSEARDAHEPTSNDDE